MIAVITGDIINSRNKETSVWLNELRVVLNRYGKEPMDWEIYRGDSFQLKIAPAKGMAALFHIKATIKKFRGMDVRMALGIGKTSYDGIKITESNGQAFIHSGETFEKLKKETIGIQTPWKSFDEALRIMLLLASIKMDEWSPISSEIVKASIEYPNFTQKDLATQLGKKQSDISKGVKRAGYDALKKLMNFYTDKIDELC